MSLRPLWEPQSGLSLTRPGIAQGQCKPQNPGNGLNVKVPRRNHRQGHGLPKGTQAHLLGPGGLWVLPPPALPSGGLRLPMVVLGQGSRVQPDSSSPLTIPEARPGTSRKSPQPGQPPLRADMRTLTQKLPESAAGLHCSQEPKWHVVQQGHRPCGQQPQGWGGWNKAPCCPVTLGPCPVLRTLEKGARRMLF